MKYIKYGLIALSVAAAIYVLTGRVWAISSCDTLQSGTTAEAGPLNTCHDNIITGFHAHIHDGSNGESDDLDPATLDVTGNTTIGGTCDITGNTTIGGTCDITGNTTIGGTADISGSTDIGGSLTVGTGAGSDSVDVLVNVDSGDPSLTLQANNSSSNAWKVLNDNDDSDILKFIYGGSTKVWLKTDSSISLGNGYLKWEIYTGTTDSDSETTIDSNAPGTPLSFQCCLLAAGGSYRYCSTHSPISGDYCMNPYMAVSANDLRLATPDTECQGVAYRCILIYQ